MLSGLILITASGHNDGKKFQAVEDQAITRCLRGKTRKKVQGKRQKCALDYFEPSKEVITGTTVEDRTASGTSTDPCHALHTDVTQTSDISSSCSKHSMRHCQQNNPIK